MGKISFLLTLFVVAGCADKATGPTTEDSREQSEKIRQVDVTTSMEFAEKKRDFNSYWFSGLAELTRYDLKQQRYGEIRDGEAVNVFVTEPFLPDEQVKHEFGDRDDVQVLKLNHYRRFYTGVYPYTLMTSSFVPALTDQPMIKLTSTVQEWCGQVFTQLNRKDEGGWDTQSFSYFQAEGDRDFVLPEALLEDELMTQIRKNPAKLDEGPIEVVPAFHYLRLMHKEPRPYSATATLSEPQKTDFSDAELRVYTLEFADLDRTLNVYFRPEHPYMIEGWEEIYPGLDRKEHKTVARRTKSIMLDYWSKNGTDDAVYRDALGLQF